MDKTYFLSQSISLTLVILISLIFVFLGIYNSKKYQDLKKKLLKFRDDELEHKDIATEHDGQKTPGYKLLKFVVQSGCKAAIKISEKI